MNTIYNNTVKNIGVSVNEFQDEGMFITFGDTAPDELKDYCYIVDVVVAEKDFAVGQIVDIDDNRYSITAVGYLAKNNLESLGHATFSFTGATEAELPGTIYLEKADVPSLNIGSTIQILA